MATDRPPCKSEKRGTYGVGAVRIGFHDDEKTFEFAIVVSDIFRNTSRSEIVEISATDGLTAAAHLTDVTKKFTVFLQIAAISASSLRRRALFKLIAEAIR